MSYDPNGGERFTYVGYDGELHVSEYPPDEAQWRIFLRNRLRLAQLAQREREDPLNPPEFTAEPEVR